MASTGQATDLVAFGPWPKGMNNRALEYELPEDALRDAFNVDITNGGRLLRRQGVTQLLAGSMHSVFGGTTQFLFVHNGDLKVGVPPNHTVLRSGVGPQAMSYVEVNGDVYYSNNQITGRVLADGSRAPWGVPTPITQPVAVASAAGGLYAGRYQVAIVHVAIDGEESGTLPTQSVDVVAGGGIALSVLPQPTDPRVTAIRIYVSKHNDDQLYRHTTVPVGTTSLLVGAAAGWGDVIATLLMQPMPPCSKLCEYRGRIYGVDALDPRIVWYTEPMRYGLMLMRQNFLYYPAPVTLLQPSLDGIYIAANKTYFLSGKTPKEFEQVELFPHGAVDGTGVRLGESNDVMWFGPLGFVRGAPGGKVTLVSDGSIAAPGYNSGASLYREARGMRQVVTTMRGRVGTQFEAPDFVDAATIRSEP